jgi:hypothetical protein
MELISTVTHRGERDAVLTVLEDGGSFLAPVFDAEGELIAYYEGDMEKLGELVSEFVTGTAQPGSPLKFAKVPGSESLQPAPPPHDPARLPGSGGAGPTGVSKARVSKSARVPHRGSHDPDHDPAPIPPSNPVNPAGHPIPGHPMRGRRTASASSRSARSGAVNPKDVPDEILSRLSELARAYLATLDLAAHDALTDASASSHEQMAARPA